MADLYNVDATGLSGVKVGGNGLNNTVGITYGINCNHYKIIVKNAAASAIDLRAEDDAVQETVQAIVNELNPLSFFVTNDNSGTIFVVMDKNINKASELQVRIRRIGKDASATTTSIGPNDIDISGTTVTPAVTISMSTTLSTVVITGTAGQFSCYDAGGVLEIGQQVIISGTAGGTGSINGYSDPTTYYIIATNGATTFTLSTTATGSGVTTTAGTPTGLTYTLV
jgi:hypothetical protein